MKLPRWLVIAMLTSSVLAVLAAAGWWWVTWPERTLRTFTDLVGDARFDEANDLLQKSPASGPAACWRSREDGSVILLLFDPGVAMSGTGWKMAVKDWQASFQKSHQELDTPTWPDWIKGRRRLRLLEGVCILTAQRGKVTVGGFYEKHPLSYPSELQVHSFPGEWRLVPGLESTTGSNSTLSGPLETPDLAPSR